MFRIRRANLSAPDQIWIRNTEYTFVGELVKNVYNLFNFLVVEVEGVADECSLAEVPPAHRLRLAQHEELDPVRLLRGQGQVLHHLIQQLQHLGTARRKPTYKTLVLTHYC